MTITTDPDAPPAAPGRTVLFSAMKNEAPFVLEWIAYHKVIGFDEIVICSNPSNDGMEEILAALAAAGEIRHLQAVVPAGQRPQAEASATFRRDVAHRYGDWYLWLDADEFLNVHVGDRTVDALIAALGTRQCAMINWRIFGTAGHARFSGRFVSDDFTRAAAADFGHHREVKSLFRFSPLFSGFARQGIHRPLVARRSRLTPEDVMTGSGASPSLDFRPHRTWLAGADSRGTYWVPPEEFGWDLAQINHYVVRTPEFYALKKSRGRGFQADSQGEANARHTPEFFQTYDRNEAEDRSILAWQDRVTAEIARMTGHRGVAEARARSAALVREILAATPVDLIADIVATAGPSEPASAPAAPTARKVLFSAMKNEAPFVLEWIAYHKVIGFDEIVICSNPSNDGTEEILAALADVGEIRHLRAVVPAGQRPQAEAAWTFRKQVGHREGDWYLWLDADEFLNVHVGDRTVDALIVGMGDSQCLLVNWRVFGSSGNPRFPGRFVDPAFIGASVPEFHNNLEQKTLFRFSKALVGFAHKGFHRPLVSRPTTWTSDDVMAGSGTRMSRTATINRRWLEGANNGRTSKVAASEFGWSLAQINHYMIRTPEFFALKGHRGRGAYANPEGGRNRRHTAAFRAENDRNEAEDRSILHWQDKVTAEIARLSAPPGVASAVKRSARQVADILAEMDPKPATSAAAAPVPSALAPIPAVAVSLADFKLTFPPAEAAYLRDRYAAATSILEYGSGGSTVLAASLGKPVIAVESDKAWADRLSAHLATISETARVHYADIGPTGDWGTPLDLGLQDRFHRYYLSVWDRPDLGEPDLVLIDGRFRVACLVAVKMRARRPTTVLFDDFHGRRHYLGVKRLARKEARVGRMARFTVTPGPIPPDMLTEVDGWFADPR